MSPIEKHLELVKKGIVHAILARQAVEALKNEWRADLIEACLIHNKEKAKELAKKAKEMMLEEDRLDEIEFTNLERFESLVPNFLDN